MRRGVTGLLLVLALSGCSTTDDLAYTNSDGSPAAADPPAGAATPTTSSTAVRPPRSSVSPGSSSPTQSLPDTRVPVAQPRVNGAYCDAIREMYSVSSSLGDEVSAQEFPAYSQAMSAVINNAPPDVRPSWQANLRAIAASSAGRAPEVTDELKAVEGLPLMMSYHDLCGLSEVGFLYRRS